MGAIEMLPSLGLAALAVFLSSVAQVMLKKEAMKEHEGFVAEYLNVLVIVGYVLMLVTTFMLIVALRVIPLSAAPVIEATSYLYVTIFGIVLFKEKINLKKMLALAVIMLGIFIYAAGL